MRKARPIAYKLFSEERNSDIARCTSEGVQFIQKEKPYFVAPVSRGLWSPNISHHNLTGGIIQERTLAQK